MSNKKSVCLMENVFVLGMIRWTMVFVTQWSAGAMIY